MDKLTPEQALEFCRQQLQLIILHSSEIQVQTMAQSCLSALLSEHIDNTDSKDAKRYQLLSSALFMSDNRPFIGRNIYNQGKYIKTEGITGEKCNQLIDPLIDWDSKN